MKKILFISLCFFLLASCSIAVKTNTLVGVDINKPNIEILPVTADLVVSAQKTRGEAIGKATNLNNLAKEALANALSQTPPSVDKPDVLVGITVFTEKEGTKLRVILTGYPAYYTNFRTATEADSLRLVIVNSDSGTSPATGIRVK